MCLKSENRYVNICMQVKFNKIPDRLIGALQRFLASLACNSAGSSASPGAVRGLLSDNFTINVTFIFHILAQKNFICLCTEFTCHMLSLAYSASIPDIIARGYKNIKLWNLDQVDQGHVSNIV